MHASPVNVDEHGAPLGRVSSASVLVVECQPFTRPEVPALLRAKSIVDELSTTNDDEAQPYAKRLALSAQITLVCRSEVAP